MNVRFFDFSTFHGKNPPTGSTQIRVHQLIKYWEGAGIYRYGEKPDVLIFQKVYVNPDYRFPINFQGIKILDICDPDYMNGTTQLKETVDAMDAVVCSSDSLTQFIKQLTDKPVITIADRYDLELIPEPKKHSEQAKSVVWFGYRHNIDVLRPAISTIDALGLNLVIIAEDDPLAWRWIASDHSQKFRETKYKFVKYEEETIYKDIQRADIAVFPQGSRPQDAFKSNNKTTKAILAGLPVVKDADSLREMINPINRQKYLDGNYEKTRQEYDVLRSIDEYKELIKQLSPN